MYSFRIQKHPFKTEAETLDMASGTSLREAYAQCDPLLPIEDARFIIGDVIITDADYIPADDEVVLAKVVPGSEEASGWGVAGFILGAVVIVVGMIVSAPVVIVVGAIVAVAGSATVGISEYVMGHETQDQRPDLHGGGSSSALWQPIPVIYGEHLFSPDFASTDYTEVVGADGSGGVSKTYLHQLYVLGNNPIIVEEIRIGDDALYSGHKLSCSGTMAGVTTTTATFTVTDTSNLLTYFGGYTDTVVSFNGFSHPQNNRAFKVTAITATQVTFTIDSEVATETNSSVVLNYLRNSGLFYGVSVDIISDGVFAGTNYPYVKSEYYKNVPVTSTIPVLFTTPGNTKEVDVVLACPGGIYKLSGSNKKETTVDLTIEYKKVTDTIWEAKNKFPVSYTEVQTTASRKLTKTINFNTSGQYLIRVSKTTDDFASEDGVNGVVLYAVTCARADADGNTMQPVADSIKTSFTYLAIRAEASPRLNGSISNLNCIVRQVGRAYDRENDKWVKGYSNNPAAIFVNTLTDSNINRYPIATPDLPDHPDIWEDNETISYKTTIPIDWDAINDWYKFCEGIGTDTVGDNGYTCNGVVTGLTTVKDELVKICIAGRATFVMNDNKYSVVVDKTREYAVQLFTPRNTSNFSAKRTFKDLKDGVKVKYTDAEMGYQENEVSSTEDDSANTYDEVSLTYVTDSTNAIRYAKYMRNVYALRQESFTFSTDFEYLVCTVGDRIKFQHDVPMLGMLAGRISGVVLDSSNNIVGLDLDESVTMVAGSTYAMEIRVEDTNGSFGILTIPVNTVGGTSNTVILTASEPLHTFERGYLFAFGLTGYVVEDLIIADISCGENLTATITGIKYDPNVYDLDNTTVWSSDISTPASGTRSRSVYIPTAIDRSISAVEEALLIAGGTTYTNVQPDTPYRVGDSWVQGISTYTCTVARSADDIYTRADWVLTASEAIQVISKETFATTNPEHRWYTTSGGEYPLLQIHGMVVNSKIGLNVKENVLANDGSYWESATGSGALIVPTTITEDGLIVSHVRAVTGAGQVSYIWGRHGVSAWQGEAYENLIVSPEAPATQNVVLEEGSYVLQCYTGSVTCYYGVATPSSPLVFMALVGPTAFTIEAGTTYASLSFTVFIPSYGSGAVLASTTPAITIGAPSISGRAYMYNGRVYNMIFEEVKTLLQELIDRNRRGTETSIKPSAGVELGTTYYETNTRKLYVWNGTSWILRVTDMEAFGVVEAFVDLQARINTIEVDGTLKIIADMCYGTDKTENAMLGFYGGDIRIVVSGSGGVLYYPVPAVEFESSDGLVVFSIEITGSVVTAVLNGRTCIANDSTHGLEGYDDTVNDILYMKAYTDFECTVPASSLVTVVQVPDTLYIGRDHGSTYFANNQIVSITYSV